MKRAMLTGLSVIITIALLVSATAIVLAQSGQAQIKNKAPVVTSVTISPDDDGSSAGVQVNPVTAGTRTVTANITVRDENGHQDLAATNVVVYKPDGMTVHVPSAAATLVGGNGATKSYTYNFNMNFCDAPAAGSSTYKVVVVATDANGASGDNSASPAVFNYTELIALSLNTALIDFGALDPGETSAGYQVIGTNQGNVTLDFDTSGTNLTYLTNSIPITRVDYDLSSGFGAAVALSATSQTAANYDLAAGTTSNKSIYYRLRTPSGAEQYLPPGTYQGTITITARAG